MLAIPGSLRRHSFNRALVEACRRCAPPGMCVDVYGGLEGIPLFSEGLEAETGGGPESVRALRTLVKQGDGLVIATPEYNHSMPGVLKNAIDWLSRPDDDHVLRGKPVAVMVNPGRVSGVHDVFVCGNDPAAKEHVTGLLRDSGSVLDLGDGARAAEQLLPIWVRPYALYGTADFNFRIVRG